MERYREDAPPKVQHAVDLLFFGMSLVPALLVAWFSPTNVLSRSHVLTSYVEIVTQLVPTIANRAALSSFPEITKLVLSVLWTIVPFQIVYTCVFLNFWTIETVKARPVFFVSAILLLLLPLTLYSMFFYDPMPSDLNGSMTSDLVLRQMSTSPTWLAIWGSLFTSFTAGCIGWIMCLIYALVKISAGVK